MRDQDAGKAKAEGRTQSAPARSAAGPSADPTGILTLQRSIGNAAVVQLLAASGDGYSQEQHEHGPGCGHGGSAPVQRSEVQSVLSSAGQPLGGSVRTEMETRLGADFSDVRLHTGTAARRSAAEIGARAYTSGNHVVIGDGGGDKHTLAHELTHVIQQRRGPVAGSDNGSGLTVSDPSDRFEREAEANATRVLGMPLAPAANTGTATDAVQRSAAAGGEANATRLSGMSLAPAVGAADAPGATEAVQRSAAAEGEASATRLSGMPLAPAAGVADAPGATDAVRRSTAAEGVVQRAPGTLLERGGKAAKNAAASVRRGAAKSGPTADTAGGVFATAGGTGGDYGIASGIGAAGLVSGVLAVPDMVGSVFGFCEEFRAWLLATGEEKAKAGHRLVATMAGLTSNSSAVGGGLTSGAANLAPAASSVPLGQASGVLGIVNGLITAVNSSMKAHEAIKQTKALRGGDGAKDYKAMYKHFQDLQKVLEHNHDLAKKTMYEHFMEELAPARQLPAPESRVRIAALKGRYEERLEACDHRYALAKLTVHDNLVRVEEAANLQSVRELGERKGERRSVRQILTALSGTLNISVGALAIAAVALGLTGGAIPIAGQAIAGLVGLIGVGLLTWQVVNKVRANLKHLESDPAFQDHTQWGIFAEAMKIWKPKLASSRDKAAETLLDALKNSQYPENKAEAERLAKALRLNPQELVAMPEAKEALAKIKDRLAST
ncbi:hypothetical protein Caci_4398 [Catenulispora acidiphila DSM 44928]|uniref:eCIS core domain-containing protein n=1 Tax=Catenulispora acidiphila (strain DSM 44928 / JCM 14897 / NBRC 102108 / NRRL B-24433 / ID139908) TaxID=479433 RepID=C7QK24_CATAD|nr:DUF4157 domain-containing protein [Catenulispora acidiphila]ACU73262.1 hypothetical protein Caci_4398 [Catenulispora acidiphila DSM 44928]